MKVTVKFVSSDGVETVAIFDREAGTVSDQNGRKGKFVRADGQNVVQISGDENLSLTLADELQFNVGFSTSYSASNGRSGTATITSID